MPLLNSKSSSIPTHRNLSGQVVDPDILYIYIYVHMYIFVLVCVTLEFSGMNRCHIPFLYLEVPIFKGKRMLFIEDYKIKLKFTHWKVQLFQWLVG